MRSRLILPNQLFALPEISFGRSSAHSLTSGISMAIRLPASRRRFGPPLLNELELSGDEPLQRDVAWVVLDDPLPAAGRGVFIGLGLFAGRRVQAVHPQLADQIARVDAPLGEITEQVLLRHLSPHEDRDPVQVLPVLVAKLATLPDRPEPAVYRQVRSLKALGISDVARLALHPEFPHRETISKTDRRTSRGIAVGRWYPRSSGVISSRLTVIEKSCLGPMIENRLARRLRNPSAVLTV